MFVNLDKKFGKEVHSVKIIKRLIIFIFVIFFILVTLIFFKGYKLYLDALKSTTLEEKISTIKADNNYVFINDLPEHYKNAVIAVEDRRFYSHGAIDFISIGRAIVTNIKQKDLVEGGSTITQQVAKNIFFTQKQEATRKIAEIFMAFYLEEHLSKDEILELYVNTCYFGDGYYGIKEASEGYFHKSPINMTLDECTLIAGIPNAPSIYAPTKNPDLARKRQNHVIESMVENGYLSKEQAYTIKE